MAITEYSNSIGRFDTRGGFYQPQDPIFSVAAHGAPIDWGGGWIEQIRAGKNFRWGRGGEGAESGGGKGGEKD
jgi:hypothetical protein